MIRARKNSTAVVISPTVTTATRGRKKVLPDSLGTVTTATRGRKKVLPDSLGNVTAATRGRKKVLPDGLGTVTTATRGRKKVLPDSLGTVTAATRGRKKVLPDSLGNVTTATRGRKKVLPDSLGTVTTATRGRKKVLPDSLGTVTTATRGRKKAEPTVTIATRGRNKVEPAVTAATRGRKKVEPVVTTVTRGRKKALSKLPATRKKGGGETGVQQYGGIINPEILYTNNTTDTTYTTYTKGLPTFAPNQQRKTTSDPPTSLSYFKNFLININNKHSTNNDGLNITDASNKYTKIKKRKEELEDDPEYTKILEELKEDTDYQEVQFDDDIEDKDEKIKAKKERKEFENNSYNNGILQTPNKGGRKPRLIVKKTLRRKKYRGGTLQEKIDRIAGINIINKLKDLTAFLSKEDEDYHGLISEELKKTIKDRVTLFATNIKKYGIEKVCKLSNKEERDKELAYYIYVLRNEERVEKVVESYKYSLILQNSTPDLLSTFKSAEEEKPIKYIDPGYNFFYRPNPEFHIYGMQLPHQFNRVELLSTMYKLHNRGIYSIVDLHDCNGGTNRQHPDLYKGIGCNPYDRDCELDIWAFALQSNATGSADAAYAKASSSAASKATTAPSGTIDTDLPLTEQFVFSNANRKDLDLTKYDKEGVITLKNKSVTPVTPVTPTYYSVQYKDMTPGSLLTWYAISKIKGGLNDKANSIVIHCLAGAGRTGSVMLYLLMRDYCLLYTGGNGEEEYKKYLGEILNLKLFGCESVDKLKDLLSQYFVIMDTKDDQNALSIRCMLHELSDTSFEEMKSGTRASLFRQRLNRIIFFLAREFDIKNFKTYISPVTNGNGVTSTTKNIEEEFGNVKDVEIDDWNKYNIDKLYGDCDNAEEEEEYEERFKEVLGWLN